MSRVGLIAIGRNEGDRLRRCLASVAGSGLTLIYVDSGSTDGSVDLAREFGAAVVELDTSIPFSAARARNAGLALLKSLVPEVDYVQFLDGDCEVASGWIEKAVDRLDQEADLAVVCGRRREIHPESTIYNRLMDVEWDTAVGESDSCGGDAMMRVASLDEVGGYNDTVVAGEEPELCHRLRQRGWRIFRIDAQMTRHDAAMDQFGQWWKRQVRSGYGAMDVVNRFGISGFRKEVRSCRAWTIGWSAGCIVAGAIGAVWIGLGGVLIGALFGAGLWLWQVSRVTRWLKQRGLTGTEAIQGGLLLMLGKWAQLVGQWRYFADLRSGQLARMIDYKAKVTATQAEAMTGS